jgi:hypothetical protein
MFFLCRLSPCRSVQIELENKTVRLAVKFKKRGAYFGTKFGTKTEPAPRTHMRHYLLCCISLFLAAVPCYLAHEVLSGGLDLAIVTEPPESKHLTTVNVGETPFYIALPEEDELAYEDSVTLDMLAG